MSIEAFTLSSRFWWALVGGLQVLVSLLAGLVELRAAQEKPWVFQQARSARSTSLLGCSLSWRGLVRKYGAVPAVHGQSL